MIAGLLFRLIAATGEAILSDDIYRYVWDGRVQLAGIHPYVFAPADPELSSLRDAGWARINHPEVRTIYPPLAQVLFWLLAACGQGVIGFKLALGLADFAAVLLLRAALRSERLPEDRVLLYAWSPLAVIEAAGSGHLEPVAVALLLCAVRGWQRIRPGLATLALAASVQVKLLPVVLFPVMARDLGWRRCLPLFLLGLFVPMALYAVQGPALGPGLIDFAARWEANAPVYRGLVRLLELSRVNEPLTSLLGGLQARLFPDASIWSSLYAHVWPRSLARGILAMAGIVVVVRALRRPTSAPSRSCLELLGTMLLLSPVLHPWYLLWLLPFAAMQLAWPWLLLIHLSVLAYLGTGGDLPLWVLAVEFSLPAALHVAMRRARHRGAGRSEFASIS